MHAGVRAQLRASVWGSDCNKSERSCTALQRYLTVWNCLANRSRIIAHRTPAFMLTGAACRRSSELRCVFHSALNIPSPPVLALQLSVATLINMNCAMRSSSCLLDQVSHRPRFRWELQDSKWLARPESDGGVITSPLVYILQRRR